MALPVDGQTNWGDPLNAFITALQSQTNTVQTNLTSHAANSPTDPHGDRAYAQTLVTPLTTGLNGPNGLVQLNSSGNIPPSLITGTGGPGGAYTRIYDAVATYGMSTSANDNSVSLQNALNAASSAGGGIVYIGSGNYLMADYVVIGNNTWLLMAEGCVLRRVAGAVNPPYMITNVRFGTSNTPSTNLKITGGRLDTAGPNNLTSACTALFVIQSSKTKIEDMTIFGVYNAPPIEINGCVDTHINNVGIDAPGTTSGSYPAIRLNYSSSSTTPAGLAGGLYSNAVTTSTMISNCRLEKPASGAGAYTSLVSFDFTWLTSATAVDTLVISNCVVRYNIDYVFLNQGGIINWSVSNLMSQTSILGSIQPFYYNAVDVLHYITPNANLLDQTGQGSYRLLPDGNLQISFDYLVTGAFSDGTTIFTLPAGWRPTNNHYLPVATNTRNSSNANSTYILVAPNGTVKPYGITYTSGTTVIAVEGVMSML